MDTTTQKQFAAARLTGIARAHDIPEEVIDRLIVSLYNSLDELEDLITMLGNLNKHESTN